MPVSEPSGRWLPPQASGIKSTILGLAAIAPYALFTYITGQLSIVALSACVLSAWGLTTGRQWPAAMGLILASLKPHIVALPMILVVLELMYRRHWQPLLIASGVLVAMGLVAVLLVPAWPRTMLASWAGGAFYEPRDNLLGLSTFDVPLWLTYPFVAYALLLWWHRNLDAHVLALAVAVNLLTIPYSRSYDYVLLLLPLAAARGASPSPQRRVSLGLVLLAQLLPLFRVFIPQAGLAEVLAPVLCTLGMLLISQPGWIAPRCKS